ncbi:hypothetical protein [Nocardia caishijiensis]|uniref:Uncharacterized protein n=1 Tax=Nocardia caishijiensis TaxID=184756 RepID=A0ABQ6YGV2_9NOCA|nr:hypothetical protein [Nocardia caishijiensis]KAF0845004.1 hypothetical protein FNL39_10932 [Nocardia caishijiensis]
MSDFILNPSEMHALSGHLGVHATMISTRQPIAKDPRESVRTKMAHSVLAEKVEDSLTILDSILKYHAGRLTQHGVLIKSTVTAFEKSDGSWASGFN